MMNNLALERFLNTLRSGRLDGLPEYRKYINDLVMTLYQKPVWNESDIEEAKTILTICNIVYNNADQENMVLEDGIYDIFLEKYKTYDSNFQVGGEVVHFSPTNTSVEELAFKSAIYFVDTTGHDDMKFKDTIVTDETKYINYRDFESTNVPLSDEYISKRYHDVSHNHPELVGTLDKCKFVLDRDAAERGVLNDSNVKTVERDFFREHINRGIINTVDPFDMVLELKYDGISIEADCTDEVVSARSRGDTGMGKAADLTPLLKGYKFPHRDPNAPMIGVKFEAIVTMYDLPYFNAAKGYEYKNCRSAIVGLLSSSDAWKYRDFITLVPLAVEEKVYRETCNSDRLREIEFLNSQFVSKGCILRHTLVSGNYIENLAWINLFTQEAESLRNMVPFMYDGIVVSYRDERIRQALGRENFVNKYSIAVKFNPLRKETIFRGCTFTVGQDGSITPMIHYDPVEFYGTIHPKSSGHSYARFMELGLRRGDIITVEYMNDVMPYVSKPFNDLNLDNEKVNPLEEFPVVCPVCGQPLVVSDSGKSVKCINNDCGGRQLARMVNMFNKLGLNGFGEATVTQLGYYHLKDLIDAFISKEWMQILQSKGFGPVECENIDLAMMHLINDPMMDTILLGSIGFTGISTKTWQLILSNIPYFTLHKLIQMNEEEAKNALASIKGIGPTTADTIVREFKYFEPDIEAMIKYGTIMTYTPKTGKKVRFTGFRDKELVAKLNQLGFDADDNSGVTKDTDILLVPVEGHTSTKTQKAQSYGVTIISVNEFIENLDKYK